MAQKLVPSPRSWPLIGTLGELLAAGGAQKLHEYVHMRHQQLGPIYKEKIGPVTGVFVSSADYMRRVFAVEGRYPNHIIPESWALYNELHGQKRGLLFMEGEEWYEYRKLLNGIILRPNSVALNKAVAVAANGLLEEWAMKSPRNIQEQLYTWSLQNMIAILLGAESYNSNQQEIKSYVHQLGKHLHEIFVESAALSLLPAKFAQKWNLPPWKRFESSVTNTLTIANELMENLKAITTDNESILKQLKETNMKDGDINRIVIDLILAAGDTTAYTTQWLLYLLSKHKKIQQELHAQATASDSTVSENPLLKGAIRETLRLYPVAPFVTRYMPRDVDIDGFTLSKGDLVIMSLYTSGRDEANFPDPLEFQPERWTREGPSYKNVINAQGSLPFAMGARACIGRKMAETQIATTLAKILKKYEISRDKNNDVGIELKLIAVPSEPIEFTFKPRI